MPAKRKKAAKKTSKKAQKTAAKPVKKSLHILLEPEQDEFLKIFRLKIQASSGLKLSKSQLIRSLIDYARLLEIPAGEISSLEDLESQIRRTALSDAEKLLLEKGVDLKTIKKLQDSIF